jgi:hypothetical protein
LSSPFLNKSSCAIARTFSRLCDVKANTNYDMDKIQLTC